MPTSPAEKLGKLVRKARLSHDLTLRELASELGIDFTTISKLESGKIESPAVGTLQRMSRVLDIPLEDLYALTGNARKEGLPEFPVYLRSKYGLSAAETAELAAMFEKLRAKKGGRGGTKRST